MVKTMVRRPRFDGIVDGVCGRLLLQTVLCSLQDLQGVHGQDRILEVTRTQREAKGKQKRLKVFCKANVIVFTKKQDWN